MKLSFLQNSLLFSILEWRKEMSNFIKNTNNSFSIIKLELLLFISIIKDKKVGIDEN